MPKALLEHYPKPRVVVALKTRQSRDALRQSQMITKRLDDQWFYMQLDAMGVCRYYVIGELHGLRRGRK